MNKKDVVIIANLEPQTYLTITEICEVCHLQPHQITEYVNYAIVEPQIAAEDWLFDLQQLERLQTALRLQRDLELNLAGVAVVLDLLQERNELHHQLLIFKKHYA